ncbi:hypothetical protein Tdes44962_MAKER08902 [Teratosphaeria destructans]|uniref:Uncharacterized protein n=1 Tax=Teratosphaeria destructans TaxID=418781 RepID=A0A9W7W3N9_9PEZI|nr:hypothetical protein Tdes44962_MAKER08902 [Teratosphaeria destructans]
MDTAMQIDPDSTQPVQRGCKRAIQHRDDDSDDDRSGSRNAQLCPGSGTVHYGSADAPSKRHRNSIGGTVHRRPGPLRYKAHTLLNDLAFSKLYVTANFPNYNPASSPVVICFVAQHDFLYKAL